MVPKPKLYSAPWEKEEEVIPVSTPECEIGDKEAKVLWDRIIVAWPFLAKNNVKVVLGPDKNGYYTTMRFTKSNGRMHLTVSGSNYEQ